jgi:hypothetical protein
VLVQPAADALTADAGGGWLAARARACAPFPAIPDVPIKHL